MIFFIKNLKLIKNQKNQQKKAILVVFLGGFFGFFGWAFLGGFLMPTLSTVAITVVHSCYCCCSQLLLLLSTVATVAIAVVHSCYCCCPQLLLLLFTVAIVNSSFVHSCYCPQVCSQQLLLSFNLLVYYCSTGIKILKTEPSNYIFLKYV